MTQISGDQDTREASFGFLIQTLARRIDVTMKARLQAHGVDFKIFANLMALAQEDGLKQREIGAKLDFPEYYVSRNVDALVKAGYAERRPDPNSRRSQLVFLTEAGRDKAAELPALIQAVNDAYLKDLSVEERRVVIDLLKRVSVSSRGGETD